MKPAALLAFLAASSAATAFACSCARGLSLMLPETDQSGVPANTRIYVGDAAGPGLDLPGGAPPPVLLDAAGAEVPVEHSTLQSGFGALRVLTPSSPLEVGRRYTVEIEAFVVTTFVVATAADTEAPPVPQVVDTDGSVYYGSDCGDSFWAQYTVQAQGPLLLLDRDGTARYAPTSVSGSVTSVGRTERTGGPNFPSVGHDGGCGGNWAEASAGSTARTRFAVIDLAGNFSGWSVFEESAIPFVGCGGCSGAPGLSAFALAGLLARRRRSR